LRATFCKERTRAQCRQPGYDVGPAQIGLVYDYAWTPAGERTVDLLGTVGRPERIEPLLTAHSRG
jgi:hypothetical protein